MMVNGNGGNNPNNNSDDESSQSHHSNSQSDVESEKYDADGEPIENYNRVLNDEQPVYLDNGNYYIKLFDAKGKSLAVMVPEFFNGATFNGVMTRVVNGGDLGSFSGTITTASGVVMNNLQNMDISCVSDSNDIEDIENIGGELIKKFNIKGRTFNFAYSSASDNIQLFDVKNNFNWTVGVNCDITQFFTNQQYFQNAIQSLDNAIATEKEKMLKTKFITKKRKGPGNDKGGKGGGGLGGIANSSLKNLFKVQKSK